MKTISWLTMMVCISLFIYTGKIYSQPDSLWQLHFGGTEDDQGFDAYMDQWLWRTRSGS